MRRALFFSILDAKSGYFQVPVEEASKKYLACNVGIRKFHWNFMPMGVNNAPMVFSRIMHSILGDLDFVGI